MAIKKRELQYVIDGYVNSRFYKGIQGASKAIGRTKQSLQGLNSVQKQSIALSKRAGRGFGSFGGGLLKSAIGFGAAYLGARQLMGAYTSLTGAAYDQIKAETRLNTLMGNVKGTTKAQIQGIKTYAAQLQKVTTVGDEVTISGASQLATFQLQSKNIKKLMPALQDLAVGTYGVNVNQEQIIQSSNLLGKVFVGQVGALSRVGISFTKAQQQILKTGTQAEKTATLVEVINQNYGGLARKMANTPEGRVARLANAWGDVKEQIGFQLIPVQEKAVKYLADNLPQIQTIIKRIIGAVGKFAAALKPVAMMVYRIGSFVVKNWSWIGPLVMGVVGAMLALKAVMGVLTVAQLALNVAMTANPIGLIVVGIGLLIGVIVLLVKHWDAVKAALARAWDWFVRFGTEGPGRFIPVINIVTLLAKNWGLVIAGVKMAWDWVKKFCTEGPGRFNPITMAIQAVTKNWDTITAAVRKAWDWVKKFISVAKQVGKYLVKGSPVGLAISAAKKIAGRAVGGPVYANRPYVVGERGPELFSPGRNGTIIPNLAMAGGGGLTINSLTINVPGGNRREAEEAGRAAGRSFAQELERYERDRRRRSFRD